MAAQQKLKKIVFVSRPRGEPKESDFRFEEENTTVQDLIGQQQGEFVALQTLYLSVDPYMRGRMKDQESYIPPFQLNQVLSGGGVGRVIASKHPSFKENDIVLGVLPWQNFVIFNTPDQIKSLRKLEGPITQHPSYALSVLGMPGLTAYFGLIDICNPKEEETVVVSGAAGAVGSIVGQIAKLLKCRVIGIAGTDEKVAYLKSIGFDEGINYKKTEDIRGELKRLCPKGIDVYFDNVGGPISDAAHYNLAVHARISLCGQISAYNEESIPQGPRLDWILLSRGVKKQGFIITREYGHRFPEGLDVLSKWFSEGKIKVEETVTEGLENTPRAFIGMLKGENTGKAVVKIAD